MISQRIIADQLGVSLTSVQRGSFIVREPRYFLKISRETGIANREVKDYIKKKHMQTPKEIHSLNGESFMSCREMDIKKDYIVNSHERCRQYKVEQDRIYSKRIISGNELIKKLYDKRELIDTAEFYMNNLFDFVKGSNFFVLLTDEEGCILSIIGNTLYRKMESYGVKCSEIEHCSNM